MNLQNTTGHAVHESQQKPLLFRSKQRCHKNTNKGASHVGHTVR